MVENKIMLKVLGTTKTGFELAKDIMEDIKLQRDTRQITQPGKVKLEILKPKDVATVTLLSRDGYWEKRIEFIKGAKMSAVKSYFKEYGKVRGNIRKVYSENGEEVEDITREVWEGSLEDSIIQIILNTIDLGYDVMHLDYIPTLKYSSGYDTDKKPMFVGAIVGHNGELAHLSILGVTGKMYTEVKERLKKHNIEITATNNIHVYDLVFHEDVLLDVEEILNPFKI